MTRILKIYYSSFPWVVVLFLLFLSFITAFIAFVIVVCGFSCIPLILVLIFLVIMLSIEVLSLRQMLSHRRRVSRMIRLLENIFIEYRDGKLVFSKPVRARAVRVVSTGYWIRGEKGRHYSFKCSVEKLEPEKESTDFEVKDQSYGIVIYSRGEGAVVLPGIELLDPELKGALVLVVPNIQPVFKGESLYASSPHGDYAYASVEQGPGLKGILSLSSKVKARGARVELKAKLLNYEFTTTMSKVSDHGSSSFEAKLAPSKPLIIFTNPKDFSPRDLAEALEVWRLMVGNMPDYTLRLVIDMPVAKDVVVSRLLEKQSLDENSRE